MRLFRSMDITMLNRVRSAMRYLQMAEPPHRWRLHYHEEGCPSCGHHRFVALGSSHFFARCLGCKANLVTLSTVEAIRATWIGPISSAYELSSFGATLTYLRSHASALVFSEYMPDHPYGQHIDGILNEDVQDLTFADGSFDIVTNNSVLEHVPDDLQGFAEMARVLKPAGRLYMTIPLYDTPSTVQLAQLSNGTIEWLREPEYHDSRLGGPKSAPVFWRHSVHDICQRVKSQGFASVELFFGKGLPGISPHPVVVATKASVPLSSNQPLEFKQSTRSAI